MAPDDVWTRPCDSDCTPPEVHKIEPFNDKSTANNMKRRSNSSIRVKDVTVCVCVYEANNIGACAGGKEETCKERGTQKTGEKKRGRE